MRMLRSELMTRGQLIRMGTAAAAILLVLTGVFTHSWWSASIRANSAGLQGTGFESVGIEMTMDVGLRSVKACMNGLCDEAEWNRINPRGVGAFFRMCSTVTFFGGIAACVLLAIGVFLRETQSVDKVAIWGSTLFVVIAPFTVLTVFTFPGGGSTPLAEVHTSVGYSFFVTLLGAVGGAIAGRMNDSSGWEGREYRPIGNAAVGAQPPPSVYPGVGTAPPAAGAQPPPSVYPGAGTSAAGASAPPPQGYEYDAAIRDATATAPPPRNIRDLKRQQGVGATPNAAVDSVRSTLRYVARSIELIPGTGMSVVLENGGVRDLLWSQVGRVVARRLPNDPPYEKTLVVDIVPLTPPIQPVRLLPSTQANYSALAGGAALNSTENLRKLGQDIAAAKPGVIEPHSEAFFSEQKQAPQFQAIKQFADYDAQYRG